jgi:alpha-glucosidase
LQHELLDLIHHDESENYISNPNPRTNEDVIIKLRIPHALQINGVFLVSWPQGELFFHTMHCAGSDFYFDWYSITLPLNSTIFRYKFLLIIENMELYYTPSGLFENEVSEEYSFSLYCNADFSSWSPEAIFYQIFPDTFCRVGNTELDNEPFVFQNREQKFSLKRILSDWNDEIIPINLETLTIQYFGGNSEGIRSRIQYLKELGINAIYLNPMYKSRTNHRYDIIDHSAVDQLFGNEEQLAEMIRDLHDNDIKIIFDAVLNHTGLFHNWFDLLGEYETRGAFSDKDSIFSDYYYFHEHPYEYACWLGARELPKLKLENPEVVEHLITGKDASIKKWLRGPFQIDGWRVDTANLLGKYPEVSFADSFNRLLHTSIKEENNDGYILGESFYDPKDLIASDKYEGIMNYRGFLKPVTKWLTGTLRFSPWEDERKEFSIKFDAQSLSNQLKSVRSMIPHQNQIRMFNLLNSHDTPRFLSEVENNTALYKLAVVLLYTYIGIPSIFYGDEIGLSGGDDPYNRKVMPWDSDSRNLELFVFFKKMISLRKENRVLQYGSFIELLTEGDLYVFCRKLHEQTVIVVLNRSADNQIINLDLRKAGLEQGTLHNYFTGEQLQYNNAVCPIKAGQQSFVILMTQTSD